MSELSLADSKAKELEKEKLDIIAPMVQHLSLRKEEVNALLTLDRRRLKNINAKVEKRFTTQTHQVTKIADPKRPANLLWAIAKSACPNKEKIIVSKRYVANMSGVQVMGCFAMAAQLYKLAGEKEEGKQEGEKTA